MTLTPILDDSTGVVIRECLDSPKNLMPAHCRLILCKEIEMKNVLLLVPFTVLLASCDASSVPSVDDLRSDKALLEKTGEECRNMSRSEIRESKACLNWGLATMQGIEK